MLRSLGSSTAERPAALTGIFVLLVFCTLYLAASLILPIYLAVLLSFALSPLVRGLQRLRLPAPLGAAVVLILFVTAAVYSATLLAQPAADWMSRGPSAFTQMERRLRVVKQPLEQMTRATESVERLTDVDGKQTQKVELLQETLATSLFASTREFLAQAFLVLVLLYFLMASAGAFSRRLSAAFPQSLGETGDDGIVQQIEAEISRYLLTVSLINAGLGVAVGATMYAIGMPNPFLWGAMAGLLNFIPFVGALVSAVVIAAVSLMSFDTLGQVLLAPLLFVTLTGVEGFFITPALVGRRLLLNPIAILLAVFVWSWIWGPAGALIAVPTLAIVKIVAHRVESMRPVSILIDP